MEHNFKINQGVLEQCLIRKTVAVVPEGVTIIGEGAFKGCASIEQIILPETITEIHSHAFKGCRKLKDINMPASLCFLGDYVFHRCHSLKSIKLPPSVQELGNCVFLYCDSLEFLSIPSVKKVGKQIFLNDICLKTIEISPELDPDCICDIFTGCNKLTEVCFPDGTSFSLDDMAEATSPSFNAPPIVRAIVKDIYWTMEMKDRELLKYLTNVKQVELPEGIITIGKSCFFDKRGIMTVKLPKTLERIKGWAFRNCISLERLEFKNDSILIDDSAFKNCTALKYIKLSDGTEYELKGLAKETVEETPPIIAAIHRQVLNNFFISGTTLLKYNGDETRVVVPEGITVIGPGAFAGNEALDRVILPNTVKEIKEEAFLNCLLLQTIHFPEGLFYLGESAFENCVKLIRAQLPETLTILPRFTFNRCKLLNEVTFGSKLQEIGALAFYGCTMLGNVSFPETLRRIEDMAFYKCGGLKEIRLPESLKKLGSNIFTLSGIRTAYIDCNLDDCGMDVLSQCDKLKKLIFKEGVTWIGDKFAFHCPNLKYISLPGTLKTIGRNAFEGSLYIKEQIPNGIIGTIFLDGSQYAGKVLIPEGITAMAGGAFYGNTKVTEIILPDSLEFIGSRTFCGCSLLKTMNLPKKITVLEEGVFAYCTELECVFSDGNISVIGDHAFSYCEKLWNIPHWYVCHIGNKGFFGCIVLKDIDILCDDIGDGAFEKTAFLDDQREGNSLVILGDFVLDGKNCSGKLTIPEGIIKILPSAFSGNEKIEQITFPTTLDKIGAYAFSGCNGLKNIAFPPELTLIEQRAFERCTSLSEVTCYVKEAGEGIFSLCTNLMTISIEGLSSLKGESFYGCLNLIQFKSTTLHIIGPECFLGCESLGVFDFSSLHHIGKRAFSGCDSLLRAAFSTQLHISEYAFEDCGCLEEISLEKDILAFQSTSFSGCTALKYVNIGYKEYRTEGYSVLCDPSFPELVRLIYCSTLSCFSIDAHNCIYKYHNNGKHICIPQGIEKIEREVFKDANKLSTVIIPKSVGYMGPRGFHGTKWLEDQRTQDPLVIVNHILIDGSACQGEIIVPQEVALVSGWSFANCFLLTGVTITSPKTIVEEYAFRNCIHLKRVTTSDGITYPLEKLSDRDLPLPQMVKQIFLDCYNCFKMEGDHMLSECTGNISELTLAEGITSIGDYVFQESNLLAGITLSNKLNNIGKGAFIQCKWLAYVKNAYNVEQIGTSAFSGCTRLKYLELSDKLLYIGERAFENCTALEEIKLPEGMEHIPMRAFYRCQSLKNITLPSTLKTIGKEAFAFCYELEYVKFPLGLEQIAHRAFAWCNKLHASELPSNVALGTDAFSFTSL